MFGEHVRIRAELRLGCFERGPAMMIGGICALEPLPLVRVDLSGGENWLPLLAQAFGPAIQDDERRFDPWIHSRPYDPVGVREVWQWEAVEELGLDLALTILNLEWKLDLPVYLDWWPDPAGLELEAMKAAVNVGYDKLEGEFYP